MASAVGRSAWTRALITVIHRSDVIRLERMSPAQFQESLERAIPRLAEDAVRRGFWAPAAAIDEGRREFARFLPKGIDTPGHHFCQIVERPSEAPVGETWYVIREEGGRSQLWVDWIWIDPPFRRRGYATEALTRLEAEATAVGATHIGLGVMHDNDVAKALYSKLGYGPLRAHLIKDLTVGSKS